MRNFDIHFERQSYNCGVCSTRAKFLGKMETIESDFLKLFDNYDLPGKVLNNNPLFLLYIIQVNRNEPLKFPML